MEAGLRWLFELVVVGGYYATAFVLGSWLMALAPLAIALLVLVWAIIMSRLDGAEGDGRFRPR